MNKKIKFVLNTIPISIFLSGMYMMIYYIIIMVSSSIELTKMFIGKPESYFTNRTLFLIFIIYLGTYLVFKLLIFWTNIFYKTSDMLLSKFVKRYFKRVEGNKWKLNL